MEKAIPKPMAKSKPSTRNSRQNKRHHKGFFNRRPQGWNISEFIRTKFNRDRNGTTDQSATKGLILTSWTRNLGYIANCDKKSCCSIPRREKAAALLKAYNAKGPSSDKSVGTELLRILQAETPQTSVTVHADIDSLVLNHGIYAHDMVGRQSLAQHHTGTDDIPPGATNGRSPTPGGDDIPPGATNGRSPTPGSDDIPPGATNARSPTPGSEEDSNSCTGPGDDCSTSSNNDSTNSDSDSASMPEPDLDHSSIDPFYRSYTSFLPSRKWKLPSGATVEDTLYSAYKCKGVLRKHPSARESIRNWIVDLENPNIQALFEEKDWEAIEQEVVPLPQLDEEFMKSLERFMKVTTTEALRLVLETSLRENIASGKDNFDLQWVERVLWHFLILYENNTLNRTQCLERWYDCNVWSRIIDDSFLAIPDVILDRCELNSQSYLLRKNHNRTEVASRIKSGPRLDGILRDYPSRTHEFCIIESAPSLRGGTVSTKWLKDKKKIQRTLRDMIRNLDLSATHGSGSDKRMLEHLEVFGISTAGLAMQLSRMSHKRGYVCLFRVEEVLTIPNDVKQFRSLLLFLAGFVMIKRAVARSIEVFQTRLPASTTDRELFRQQLSSVFDRTNTRASLPPIADSD